MPLLLACQKAKSKGEARARSTCNQPCSGGISKRPARSSGALRVGEGDQRNEEREGDIERGQMGEGCSELGTIGVGWKVENRTKKM